MTLSTMAEPLPDGAAGDLQIFEAADIPDEPSPELFYAHRPHLLRSAREAWRHKDVMYTLAERDIRVTYKQALLGLGWAVLNPVLMLLIFTLLLGHEKSFQTRALNGKVIPYALATYAGLWGWSLFSQSLTGGASALVTNKVMMAKTHFPRECFPISQVLEGAFTTVLVTAPMVLLLFVYHYTPKITTVWVPLYFAIELPFVIGVILITSSAMVQARDLLQVIPIIAQFGMLATPVVWPFTKMSHIHIPGIAGYHNLQVLYSVVNPLGPVIDNIRGSVLIGVGPHWSFLGIAACSSLAYLMVGYVVFKKLEVNFADLT